MKLIGLVVLLAGCGAYTEEVFLNNSMNECAKECRSRTFTGYTYQYTFGTFSCFCHHLQQPFGTMIFQRQYTAK